MPKQIIEDDIWKDRIDSANTYYNQWEKLFKCNILDKYYEGQQWRSQRELAYNPYVINKVYETIQIKIAEFIPTFPKYTVSARPANSEYDVEVAIKSAQLKEDVLNMHVSDERRHFKDEVEMAYKDSFFRFGMMEVGYAADWIDNPNARKPLLGKDVDRQSHGPASWKVKQEPEEMPANERIYFKHVSAKRFRVGGLDHKYLDRCGWVGYFDWVNKDDLLSLKGIMNRDKIENAQGSAPAAETETGDKSTSNNFHKGNVLKIWRLWDLRGSLQLLVLDSPCVTIFQRRFKRLPLFDYRPDKRLITDGFYPIPPAYHWLSPQDEINETREMLRAHRRRFVRKFQIVEGRADDEEIEKFETGPDGALIKVKVENAISPIENANLGPELAEAVQTSGADINTISGTSQEDRQVADRTTATQANIVNSRASLRMNADRDRIVFWLSVIGREALMLTQEKFVLGLWVQSTSPEGEAFLGEIQEQQQAFKWVTTEDLKDGYDFRIDIDVTSLSVTAQQDEKQKFLEFLAVLTQYPAISFSPLLVREAAYRVGYRNDKAIKELQKMALLMELGRMNQLKAQAGIQMPENGNAPQQTVGQQTPPGMEQIRQQIGTQSPGVVQ